MAKNYLEHEDCVRFMENYLNKNTEWKWFVDLVDETFEFKDVVSWTDYISACWRYGQIFSYFQKLVDINIDSIDSSNGFINELFQIARFEKGLVSIDAIEPDLHTNFGKTFFWVIWATTLEKKDNALEFIYDNDLFQLYNLWQIRSFTTLNMYVDELIEYGSQIKLNDISKRIECLKGNIIASLYSCSESFVDKFTKCYPKEKMFGYQSENVDVNSWQERYMVALINTPIRDGDFSITNIWKADEPKDNILNQINLMNEYFSAPITKFVLESVLLIWNNRKPSVSTVIEYFALWEDQRNDIDKYENIAFWGLRALFINGFTKEFLSMDEYKKFLISVHSVENDIDLQRLLDARFPISKEQKSKLKKYYETLYQNVEFIDNAHELLDYFKNEVVCKHIDNYFFVVARDKFMHFLNDSNTERLLPNYFYWYMIFLINCKGMSTNVEKHEIDLTIIGIQKLWESTYYDKVINGMQTFSRSTEISNSEIEKYSNQVLQNPFILAKACMSFDNNHIVSILEEASNNPIQYMVTRIMINKTFPNLNHAVDLHRHDVDSFIYEYIEQIQNEKSYRLLNNLETEKYMLAVYEDLRISGQFYLSWFCKDEQLYEFIQKDSEIELLPYRKNILLAHVTQLFPLLEQKIHEMASLYGVSPFKKDKHAFMQFNDPSSLLRELIEEAYKETDGFDVIPDLMFVYCYMYNSNFYNIRNECIHGRDYINQENMRFAFRTTLISIYLIEYRINIAKSQE